MALLEKVGNYSSKVGNTLGYASASLDTLTSVAKGVLCLPTLIAGVIQSIPSIVNGITSGVANLVNGAVNNFLGAVNGVVNSKIQEKVDRINGVFDDAVAAIALVRGTIDSIFGFARYVEAEVLDLLNFTVNKDNCTHAIAELDKCIGKQIDSTLSPRSLKSIANNELDSSGVTGGIKFLSDGTIDPRSSRNLTLSQASNLISKNVGSSGGLVDRFSKKHVNSMNRAKKIATKVSSII